MSLTAHKEAAEQREASIQILAKEINILHSICNEYFTEVPTYYHWYYLHTSGNIFWVTMKPTIKFVT